MSWGKGNTEKGQGGKLGHSNRDGWGYHDEEKEISNKQRRLEQNRIIQSELIKIDQDIREFALEILQHLNDLELRFDYFEFDSGAAIIDFWTNTEMFCIQMTDLKFGWTKLDENTGFSSIPDSGFMNWNVFKPQFHKLTEGANPL